MKLDTRVYKEDTGYDRIMRYIIRSSNNGEAYCNYRMVARSLGMLEPTVRNCFTKLMRMGYLVHDELVKDPIIFVKYRILKYPKQTKSLKTLDYAIAYYITKSCMLVTQYKIIAKYFRLSSKEVKLTLNKLIAKGLLDIEWNRYVILEPLKSELEEPVNEAHILEYMGRCTTKQHRSINGVVK